MTLDVARLPGRAVVLGSLLLLPLLRMLLQHRYPILRVEVAAAVLLVLAAATLVAALAHVPWLFHPLVLALVVLLSASAVQLDLLPGVRMRWILVGSAALLSATLLALGRSFHGVLLVFLYGSFAVDVGKAAWDALPRGGVARPGVGLAADPRGPHHVVHVVLDEMLGLGSMPPDCAPCVEAARRLEEVLSAGNFRIYPNAFSNYAKTRDSVPSILNGRLVTACNEFIDPRERDGRPVLRRNSYFDAWAERGYAIQVYDSDFLRYASPGQRRVRGTTYRAADLGALPLVRMSWRARLGQIFTTFLQSDRLWMTALGSALDGERLPVGPLAIRDVWPGRLLADVREAREPTLFFAHLLTPHWAYVYEADGSLRDPADWRAHERLAFPEEQAAAYRDRYRLYGAQARYLAEQLAAFLEALRATGAYDATTIVIHGDHGSRLRLLRAADRRTREELAAQPGECAVHERYDYASAPAPRELLDRFGTLLAIKLPGATSPAVVEDPASVLSVLQQTFRYAAVVDRPEDLGAAFLFAADGTPRRIDMASAFPR